MVSEHLLWAAIMSPPKNRMSGQERKTLILEAALKVFARKGYSGARTKEIAREAGISETLVFRHFATKKNLYRQALEHLFSHHPVIDELESAMAADNDREVLYVLASHIMEHARHDERIVRLTLFSGLEGNGMIEHESAALQLLEQYLRRRMDNGALRALDASLAARFFLYGVFLYVADIHMQLTGPSPRVEVDEAAETLVDIFMKGLLPSA